MSDGRGEQAPVTARTGPAAAVAVAAVVAVTALVLLVAVWAASTGPDDPFPGDGINPDRVTTTTPTFVATGDAGAPEGVGGERDGDGSSVLTVVLGLLVLGVGVLLVLGFFWYAATVLYGVLVGRRERWRVDEPAPVPPIGHVETIRAAMLADADEQRELLSGGSPRNAIVECWHRFEVQAERAGVPREAWETSAEFTLRLLDVVEADATSVARLSALYREARFSEHEMGEDAREAGLETLARIHHDLRTLLSRGRL